MTDYSKMSDFEINRLIASAVLECDVFNYPHSADGSSVGSGSKYFPIWFNYCNNPADAWPIIIRNLISIDSIFDKGNTWLAFGGDDSEHRHVHSNPLRAAMIVFLMMKEAEQCSS